MNGKMFVIFGMLLLLLAGAPSAFAANGDGVVDSYKPNVVSTVSGVTLSIQFTNDGTECLDEIIITPPDSWFGTADVIKYDRSSYSQSRQETNDNVNLVGDDQSSRIVPDHSLCPGETVNIEISGLIAPSSYEVSDIVIKTSDMLHNAGTQWTNIDVLPKVYVTHATKLKLEYFHIQSFTGSGSSKGFTARAWGAWARLNQLAIDASVAGTLKIEMETGSTDAVIFNSPVSAGTQWITMDYSAWNPVWNGADISYGYLRDQAGTRSFYITYTGSLTLLGSTDEILDDQDYTSSGLGLLGVQGTIITAGGSEQRKIMVQLVDDNNYDVNEIIPLEAKTDLGSIVELPIYKTDTDGNKYFTLNPGCLYGVADFVVSTDPLSTQPSVTEYVGIDSNVPASFAVVEGDGAKIPAGESQLIKVEAYDSCGNLVSNTHQQFVEFDYLTTDCGSMSKLGQAPGGGNDHEQEYTDMGVADVYLQTDCQLCTHEVQITAAGLPGSPKLIYLYGVPNLPAKMKVTINENEITADQCVDALIEVTDVCGNRVEEIPSEVGDEMEQWESIVRVTIESPLQTDQPWPEYGSTHITTSDFREEQNYDTYVQGKLNNGVGHVTICGCHGLGVFDVVAISDTIEDGRDTVSVINAAPQCIETKTVDQLLSCDEKANLSVAIKDICGNYWRNQGCGSGEANYCVDLALTGDGEASCGEDGAHLSTETVCVPVGHGDPGYLQTPVTLFRDIADCCQLNIEATKGTGCCNGFPDLPQCEKTEVLFHGAPSYMTTQFFKTRTDPFTQQEQLHEQFNMEENAVETVSEEVLDLFTVYDSCGHIVKDYNGEVDVEVKGKDTASIYQVDHPLELEGGWCQGHVNCNELTQFGQEKCEETPTGEGTYCAWNSAKNEGQCSGIRDCTVIQFPTQCTNWGCTWNAAGTPKCTDNPLLVDLDCAASTSPGGGHNQEICGEVGCTWTPTYSCKGKATPNSCSPYTKEQCLMVGDAVPGSCKWINDCTREFENSIIKKLVIHNTKPETQKQWLPLEFDDIMVDKLAFNLIYEEDPALWLYVYVESEKTPGFQPGEDMLVGKAPALFGNPTIIELQDSPTPYWDDQRQGGVLIRAGDSKDFYIMLVNEKGPMPYIPCGTYGLDFLWYQDYNSPDVTMMGSGYPDSNSDGIIEVNYLGGLVEDTCKDSDNFNWIGPGSQAPHPVCPYNGIGLNLRKDSRNDDYGHSTPDYGFGDRFIYGLKFSEGQAWMKFRDLVAEHVDVLVTNIEESGETCQYTENISASPQPEEVDFVAQPATQIKLINHDSDESKIASCEGEWDEEENAFLLNIQVTDGFDNPVPKEGIQIKLDYCLKEPFGDNKIKHLIQMYCMNPENYDKPICDTYYYDRDYCFTREDLQELIKETNFGEYFGDALFGDFFGEEFSQWIEAYFENAAVYFWDGSKIPLSGDIVTTDANGQAQVYVTSKTAGYYKIIAMPTALDGDTTFVGFTAGIPDKLDIVALPSFGIPADGEEEAMLLLRAFDVCGNMVYEPIEDVNVTASGRQVVISQDFECKNNYDKDVTGTLYPGFFGCTCLAALDDIPETATITASAYGLESDTTQIVFQGAPRKLVITKIEPSDRLPADGMTGAWVTVEVQDINGNRVTGYLGEGFMGDPGDPWGATDYTFENICVKIGPSAFIPTPPYPWLDTTKFGWINFHMVYPGGPDQSVVYCGDLMFGKGQFYVVYDGQSCNHGGVATIDIYDEYPYQGQEINENGIPVSIETTQLNPDSAEADFVDPATKWDIWSDKMIVLADGMSKAVISVQVENPYMDVRQAVEGNVFIGGIAAEGSVISWEGEYDELNPTSARIVTDPLTGRAVLELTSTKPGKAEVTITGGMAYVCYNREKLGYVCPECEKVYRQFNCHYSDWVDLEPKTIEVEFIEVANNEVYIEPGWNFISTPYALTNSSLKSMMIAQGLNTTGVMALAWSSSTQTWTGSLSTVQITPLNGVWVYWPTGRDPAVLTLTYVSSGAVTPPQKNVYAGWNTVGLTWDSPMKVELALKSIDTSYTNFIDWVESSQKYGFPVANADGDGQFVTGGVNMYAKQGYWIWVTKNDVLAGLTA
jgi:hypothetical protein